MSTAATLLREDLRGFGGYRSARSEKKQGEVWLNANESAWPATADPEGLCRRYPEPQPQALVQALAGLYGVSPAQVLVGRGSDEGIDLLLRTFSAPGAGRIVIAPPVFGMYAVCARLQGAQVIEVPLRDTDDGFSPDLDAMREAAVREGASLLFLCSPGNPTGEVVPIDAIADLARHLRGRCFVVVDEAYVEFSDSPSANTLLGDHDNLVVLRTLSKAHALAGARIGCVLADPEVISFLRCAQAPYPVPQPCVEAALKTLSATAVADTQSRIRMTCVLRELLATSLQRVPGIRKIYSSQGNFLLVRFEDADAALARLTAAGIIVRDMRASPGLADALRISVGDSAQNTAVIAALTGDAGQIGVAA